MNCEYCDIYNNQSPHNTTDYWNYYLKENKMFAIWYKHEGIHNLSKCKRMAQDVQSRLLAEARKYFGTSRIRTNGCLENHLYFYAEVIQ